MFNSPSFAFQEVRAAILLVILLLWVGYFFVLRRFSTGVIILAVGLAICAQHAQGPDVDKHLTCVGTALVVGVSHGGIGLPTAKLLAERGCKVILAGRSIDRLRAAEAEIRESVPSLQSLVFEVDLANFSSVSAFADELMEQINVIEYLVLNAGIMFEGHLTNDGLNAISQVNHLSPFYLTQMLLPLMLRVPNNRARIVVVASGAALVAPPQPIDWLTNWKKVCPTAKEQFERYAESKLANVLFAKSLSDRFGRSVKVFSVHPGFIVSNLYRQHLPERLRPVLDFVARIMAKSPESGAHVSVLAALDPRFENQSGAFISSTGEVFDFPSEVKMDSATATKLWEASRIAISHLK